MRLQAHSSSNVQDWTGMRVVRIQKDAGKMIVMGNDADSGKTWRGCSPGGPSDGGRRPRQAGLETIG